MIKKLKDAVINWMLNYIHYWISQYGKDHERVYVLWNRSKYKVNKIRCDIRIEWSAAGEFQFKSSVSVLEIDLRNNYSLPDFSELYDLKLLKIEGHKDPFSELESLLK